jgi:hypothetical protein
MQTPRADIRLPRIIHAYLDELAELGVYGRGKNGAIRRFIEDGIKQAIEGRVISPKKMGDFKGVADEAVGVEEEE